MQMKTAIRKIGHCTDKESSEVLLAEGEYEEDPVEDILYGERRPNGNWRPRNQQGYQNQGYHNQQRVSRMDRTEDSGNIGMIDLSKDLEMEVSEGTNRKD